MMFIFELLVALFGVSAAIDLTGCRPQQPKIFHLFIGEVTSPGYNEGENYPDNLFCEYTIVAPPGMLIKATFADLDIEPSDMCLRDAMELVDRSGQPTGLGVYCGNQTQPPIFSQGNVLSILFRSDFMIGRRGFRLQYVVMGMRMPCILGQVPCKNRNCYSMINKCDGKDDCGDGTDEENCGFPPVSTECGVRKISGFHSFDRVIGGKEAEPGSWPWQADLQVSFIHPNGHMCGGTLINSQWVLSAAHCFQQFRHPQAWRVHLGNHHKFKKDASEQIRYGERIILYPNTTGEDLFRLPQVDMMNDMALLKLNAPVKFTDQVRPACLPTQGYQLPMGTKCIASGWGMTRGTGSNHVLKEVDLSIQAPEACEGILGPINQDTMICVRNAAGWQDVCHGDSGGPLECEFDGKWHVMGATSFGSFTNFIAGMCALPGSGTIYSKVSHKTNWITQQINKYS